MYLRLKEILKQKGITGKAFAEQLGVSENSISFIVNGKQQPRFELLKAIADSLDVDIRDLFEPTKDTDPTDPVAALKEIKRLTDVALDAQ